MRKKKGRYWLLSLALPLLLLPAHPAVSIWWFRLQEPTFRLPLDVAEPVLLRQDPYGKGHFGAKRSGGRRHRGVDLVASVGTPVVAAKSGRAFIGHIKNGLGRYVEVRHPDGWVSRYGHLKTIAIGDRQKVRRGQILGSVGKSGNARRKLIQPHLHFEVWTDEGIPVDPLLGLEKDEG